MTDWLPRFLCPGCVLPLDPTGDVVMCPTCAWTSVRRDGIWRCLEPARQSAIEPFVRQYRAIREQDGYRTSAPEYYRRLPQVSPDDPEASAWHVRQESYRTLERYTRRRWGHTAIRLLDLGAGNGWLSHCFARLGHGAVAVDWLDDDRDGLGAARHYDAAFVCVQADFTALPFDAGQFDLIAFNGSLHYARDVAATLAHARRLLATGGSLVVIDSPFFKRSAAGRAMVTEKTSRFCSEYGLTEVVHAGVGFVTFGQLQAAASTLRMRARFYQSRGPLAWQLRRTVGGLRRFRQPAAFGVWVAE